MNSTNKNISRQELFGSQELTDFKNYVLDKYSPTIIQNDCIVKTTELNNKIITEFTFNQKYGSEFIDLICEPILTYQQSGELSNSTSTIDVSNLYPILSSDDLIELSYNGKIIESYSYSTLMAKLKINKNQIINIGSKYLIPLEFDIINSGFITNSDNVGVLKITIKVEKSPTRNIELKNYLGLQIKYKSFISSKLKIKNSSQTVKFLNHYFSQPNNKKLLSNLALDSKYIIENQTQPVQPNQLAQPVQNIPVYTSINANLPHKINYSLDIIKEPSLYFLGTQNTCPQNYSNIVNSLYGEIEKRNYVYNNVQSFNSYGFDGGAFQSSIDYEQNDEIEEYKKVSESNEKYFYQKEKLFNKKISLICEIAKELGDLNNLNILNNQNQVNIFDSIILKLNGKTIFEAERDILNYDINKNGNNCGVYLIQINSSNSKLDDVDNYELSFDGLTQPIHLFRLKIFESSKYLCSYLDSSMSPQIVRI